jgi:KUP system potassium uptake protein
MRSTEVLSGVKPSTKDQSAKISVAGLTLGALGVVYGDIGTSPLYALRESLQGYALSPLNILGVLSVIFWALLLVISFKYLFIILRADNQGEGGTFALLALLKDLNKKWLPLLIIIAIIGAGLLLGDGMITPAISVLSAIEGLTIISPVLSHFVLPLTVFILISLFWLQHYGTGKIGHAFGPIILLWFITLGVLGSLAIIKNPLVLHAVNPHYAFAFFYDHGKNALLILAGVFLVVTGGEALYADLGHFGKLPMQLGWFIFALPGLVLNYFGQGALLLQNPSSITHPFYALAPSWLLIPLVILATIATVIASQAVISATFSLTRQAILLDLLPKTRIFQTSAQQRGQIYVPLMNIIIALGSIILVMEFRTSSGLASVYGLAVNLVMLAVTILVAFVARQRWKWPWPAVIVIFGLFLTLDASFLIANLTKIQSGGWVPLLIALLAAITMWTWYQGTQLLRLLFYSRRPQLTEIIGHLQRSSRIHPIADLTAIFITDPADNSGGGLLHYLKLNHALPGRVIILSVSIADLPLVPDNKRVHFETLAKGVYRLNLCYGFMQDIDIPQAITEINKRAQLSIQFDPQEITYFTEAKNITVTARPQPHFSLWQKKLFSYLQHNSLPSLDFYKLPANRTIAIGIYCEL